MRVPTCMLETALYYYTYKQDVELLGRLIDMQ